MTLEELINRDKWVRVLRNTTNTVSKAKSACIGEELKLVSLHYDDKKVTVWSEKDEVTHIFNRSDVAELTPVRSPLSRGDESKIKHVAKGDWVKRYGDSDWFLVYGYHWYCDEWGIDGARDGDLSSCSPLTEAEIKNHRPQQQEASMSDDELIRELERRGKIVSGKIVN